MAEIPGSVRFTGFIAPTDSTDTYPVTDPKWGLGGLRRVSGTTERDAISTARRESGMLVFSEAEDTYYKLGTGLTNSDWSVFAQGTTTSGDYLPLSGGTVTGVTSFTYGLSANTFSGGTFYSGGTDLYDIFLTIGDLQDLQSVLDQGTIATAATDVQIQRGTVLNSGALQIGQDDLVFALADLTTFSSAGFGAGKGSGNYAQMSIGSGFTESKIRIEESGMLLTDDFALKGIDYAANYHSNYTSRTLVDKEYVDNIISTATTSGDFIPLSGTNGVDIVTGNIEFDDDIQLSFNGGSDTIEYDSAGSTIAINSSVGVDFETGSILSGGTDLYDIFSTTSEVQGDYLPLSGGTVTGDTIFTTNVSANTMSLSTTTEAPLNMNAVNLGAPADGSIWFTTSGGTTSLNYRVSGITKSVELT